ncbi:MAG: RNA polymerase factor sigma-54 [Clostridia bacterium]|nr:RNA polymerase factor sigma-54 [Clostridia bacterium]
MSVFQGTGLELQQIQQLSVAQMQYLRLLQMNTLELNSYLNEIQLENPLIEIQSPEAFISSDKPMATQLAQWATSSPHTSVHMDSNDEESPSFEDFKADDRSLYSLEEYLKNQIDLSIDGKEYRMLDWLIGFLDANGYLTVTAEQLAMEFSCDISLAHEAIGYLQTLDPAGIGAGNLAECLQIQLFRMGIVDDDAMRLCNESVLFDLAHGHFQKVSKALDISTERISALYAIIRTLDPRPASAFGPETTVVMIPDVTVFDEGGKLSCRFNKQYSASISVNKDYLSLGDHDAAAREYLNRKMSQALWVVNSVQSRQETVERIVSVIIDVQRDFFHSEGGMLHPLKLSDVASKIGVHESTVSRAINEKYLQCRWGVYPIKHFFSTAIQNDAGESVSSRRVKDIIKSLIAAEDPKKPLSDSTVVKLLETKGIQIARRTAAKYREELGIPSSSARKR